MNGRRVRCYRRVLPSHVGIEEQHGGLFMPGQNVREALHHERIEDELARFMSLGTLSI